MLKTRRADSRTKSSPGGYTLFAITKPRNETLNCKREVNSGKFQSTVHGARGIAETDRRGKRFKFDTERSHFFGVSFEGTAMGRLNSRESNGRTTEQLIRFTRNFYENCNKNIFSSFGHALESSSETIFSNIQCFEDINNRETQEPKSVISNGTAVLLLTD